MHICNHRMRIVKDEFQYRNFALGNTATMKINSES